jgi:hypothetical protein
MTELFPGCTLVPKLEHGKSSQSDMGTRVCIPPLKPVCAYGSFAPTLRTIRVAGSAGDGSLVEETFHPRLCRTPSARVRSWALIVVWCLMSAID